MKKILYITTVSRTINAFLVPHIEMLIDKGNIVDCACCIDKQVDSSLIDKDVRIFDIPFTRNPLDLSNLKAFKKLVQIQKENKYDIVHVHTPIASIYGRLLKVKFPKLKTIYTAHGFHFHKGAPLINWVIYYPIERIMAKFTDTIITMNEEDYQRALKFNIKETHKINGVGVDSEKYNIDSIGRNEVRENLGLYKDDFIILMIAEVNKNKNHMQMIEAINVLNKKDINVKILCAGDGILLDKIRKEISERNLEDNIKMLGFRTDIKELITACDIGMLLSYREGLPRNIMELMVCGKPIIGTNIRGIKDIVDNDINGYLVDLGNINDTAKKIETLYRDENTLINLSNAVLVKSKEYDVHKIMNDLDNIYLC